MQTRDDSDEAGALFAGAGAVRRLCRSVDWSATALGPVEGWPRSLRAAVRLCLDSLTPVAIWAGPELVLLYNDGYAPVLNSKHPWAMGRPAREVWAEVWEAIRPEFEAALEHGRPARHEDTPYRLQRGGREEEAYFTYTLTPIREDDGRVVGVLNVTEETTRLVRARVQSEERAEEGEERYRTLFESIDEGFCLIEVLFEGERPVDYRFLEVNPAFEKHTGLVGSVGRRIRELVPAQEEHWFKVYGRVAQTGEPVRFELPARGMGRFFDVYAFRVGPPSQRRVAVLFDDVSQRRRAEEALRQSEKRAAFLLDLSDALRPLTEPQAIEAAAAAALAAALDVASAGYLDVAPDDQVALAARPGATDGEGIAAAPGRAGDAGPPGHRGWRCLADMAPGFRSVLLAGRELYVEDLLADQRLQPGGEAGIQPGAPALGHRAAAVLPLTKQGRLVAYLFASHPTPRAWPADERLLLREVAERTWAAVGRARAEQRVRESDQRKSEFLAVLSHELRNPLAPIRTSLHLLERAPPGSEQIHRAWEVLRRQTAHLTRLVDDLLDVTRISRGKIALQRGRVDLREVVHKTSDDLRPVFEGSRLELRVELPAGPAWVDADATRLAQVLGNLLQNALKFTPGGGVVAVRLEGGGGVATLSVRDTGAGIEPDQVERIFEPFVQGAQGLARSKGGLGLGLSLVKGLVEQHGGSVRAQSQGPGRGAEFVITLPMLDG